MESKRSWSYSELGSPMPEDDLPRLESPRRRRNATLKTHLFMMGTWLAAGGVSIVHHCFLLFLEGKSAEAYSQFWTKNIGNAIAMVVRTLLGVSVTVSLSQAVGTTCNVCFHSS